jgi:hypothetical protein
MKDYLIFANTVDDVQVVLIPIGSVQRSLNPAQTTVTLLTAMERFVVNTLIHYDNRKTNITRIRG